MNSHPLLIKIVLSVALCCWAVKSHAQTDDFVAPLSASGTINEIDQQSAWQQVGSPATPPSTGNFDINALIGANTYYNSGITGQNTRSVILEAGHIWNGTESLTHVTNFYSSSFSYGGTNINSRIDRHATWVAGVLGGREVSTNPQIYQKGIAYGTTLGSAAVANAWSGSAYTLSFGFNYNSWTGAVFPTFANSDVINQSYGFTDASGTNVYTRMMDALATANSKVVSVTSSGNSGTAGSVGSPGSGYNSITVGGLGNPNTYDSIASFSSRGPQNWGYRTSTGSFIVVSNVRAPVDIVAPASSIIAPFYGAQTGGNNPTLALSTNLGTATDSYSILNGTSFAAPIISGAISLMQSAAKTLPELSDNSEALESMVLKSILLNSATKITGWNNGQSNISGVITTTQSLDYSMGAGSVNLASSYTNQTHGQKGVSGSEQGNQGIVNSFGWDHGSSTIGGTNSYQLSGLFSSNTTMSATISWLRQRAMNTNSSTANATDIAEANLDLKVWSMNKDGSIGNLVASSQSDYNVVEQLYFQLPNSGYYIIGVNYKTNSFDNTGTWGTSTNKQNYGLAWNATSTNYIYWQSGNWSDNGSWNSTPDGSGAGISNSSIAVATVFGNGNISQPNTSTSVEGAQYTKGLVFQTTEATLDGVSSAILNIGTEGVKIESVTTGPTLFENNLSLNLQGNQTWANNSSQTLTVLGLITGNGNLTISNSTAQSKIKLSNLGYQGSAINGGAGTTEINGVISNTVTSISQVGVGTLELNAINSYTGSTTVTNGTIKVNGSISSSALTTASNAGTLGGSGTVGNTLITAAGTISPGNSPGLLTIDGDLTWDLNSNYNWQVYDATGSAGLSYDSINVTGVLNLLLLNPNERFNINIWSLSNPNLDQSGIAINFDENQDYIWTIVSTTEGITGFDPSFFNLNLSPTNNTGGFQNPINGNFSLLVNNDDLILAYNTVPEPSTIALILITGIFFWIKIKYKKLKF